MNILYKTLLRPKINKSTPKSFLEGYCQALVSLKILMENEKGELNGYDLLESISETIQQIKRLQTPPCRIE